MLTERQREVLEFIVEFTAVEGFPPTIREMCSEFGHRSPNGPISIIRALQSKGFICHTPNLSRGIRVLDTGSVRTVWGEMPVGI